MIMRSPIAALLWENWRLSRNEAAQRLGLGVLGGSAAMLMFGNGANAAFWILFMLNAFFYMSIARLNGGRFVDGYKPGFPLYLQYSRPVPTVTFVSVAMAYDAVTGAASYLVTAALLMFVFGQPFPLFGMALLIVALHLGMTCIQWSTRSRVIQWIGCLLIAWPVLFMLQNRAPSPHEIEFSPAAYAVMFLVGVASIALTVAGVARQRRGEAVSSLSRPAGSSGYPDWLVSLFRFPCPISSATRAQVWFELKTSGLPSLAMGLGLAVLMFLLFAVSISVEYVRPIAIFSLMVFLPTLLLFVGGNAFGIRRRQGRTYASAFEMTQPYGSARLVGLKLSVRTVCVLIALIAMSVSVWASTSLIGAWGSWMVEGGKDAVPELLAKRQIFADVFAGQMGYSLAAQAFIASVAVALMIALLAALQALRARYPRRMLIAGSLLLLHGLALIALMLARLQQIASAFLVKTVFAVTGWSIVAAMVLATLYLFWSGFAERSLTVRYTSVAVLISAAVATAWLTVLHAFGVQFAGMSAAEAVGLLWPVLLALLASVLAPWSFGRVRHT